MADLTTEQKTVLVTALAHFNTPAEVSVMMLEEYGIEITIQHVCSYDPTRPAFRAGYERGVRESAGVAGIATDDPNDDYPDVRRSEQQRIATQILNLIPGGDEP